MEQLSRACPQLKIYSSLNELYDTPSVQSYIYFDSEVFPVLTGPSGTLTDPSQWEKSFHEWLDRIKPIKERKHSLRVYINVFNYYWPIQFDGLAFAKKFGKLARPREDARRLAAIAMSEMNKKFNWSWNPKQKEISRKCFVGVYLGTNTDNKWVTNVRFMFKARADWKSFIERRGLPFVYRPN